MVYLFLKNSRNKPEPLGRFDELPVVTVQLPIFNELHVVERLIRAVGELDYPKEKLHIQVLDDSTDETLDICRTEVEALAAEGFDIELIHRVDRTGFKAGALENGMKQAKGEFIYILDADFIPEKDALMQMIHYLHRREDRHDPDPLGSHQPPLLAVHPHPGDVPRRPPAGRADRAQPQRALLQLQRHRRHVAQVLHHRRRRLGARHADRGSRPQLPRAAEGLEVHLPQGRRHARRAAGGHGRLQIAAAPLGERFHPDL